MGKPSLTRRLFLSTALVAVASRRALAEIDLFGETQPEAFSAFDLFGEAPEAMPRILCYTMTGCTPCNQLKAFAPKSNKFRYEFKPTPKWVTDEGHTFPVLHWEYTQGKWTFQDGWSGEEKFEAVYLERKKPRSMDAPAAARRTGSGPSRGGYSFPRNGRIDWSVSGDWTPSWQHVYRHLVSGHGISASAIQGMGTSELIDLHDSCHNGTLRTAAVQNRRRGLFGLRT